MLYDRDHRQLTKEETDILDEAENKLNLSKNGSIFIPSLALTEYWNSLSFPIVCYKTMFPNNYLDPHELGNKERIKSILTNFEALLNSSTTTERDVLNFIRDQKAYFIIGSIFGNYDFGHHEAYTFKEFDLPPLYKCDYLLVGKNSGGYEFIFIELENPVGNVTSKNGDLGTTIRKGLKQIEDWDTWIETNYSHLKLVFESKSKSGQLLPKEFYEFDKSRIHYVVIAGRRKDFSERTYRLKRKSKKNNSILLLHYDNLIDGTLKIIGNVTY